MTKDELAKRLHRMLLRLSRDDGGGAATSPREQRRQIMRAGRMLGLAEIYNAIGRGEEPDDIFRRYKTTQWVETDPAFTTGRKAAYTWAEKSWTGQATQTVDAGRIHAFLKANKINYSMLASRLGISRSALYNKLNGKTAFSIAETGALATMMGVGLSDLVEGA